MAIQGEPDAELEDLLGEIESIQRAAMKPIRAGAMGARDLRRRRAAARRDRKHHNHWNFSRTAWAWSATRRPRLTDRGPVPYPSEYAERPLEAGMVVSVETTLMHPARGFIKLEDTVVVTDSRPRDLRRRRARLEQGGTAANRRLAGFTASALPRPFSLTQRLRARRRRHR